MLLDNFQYFPGDAGVAANITTINFPVAQLFHLCILGWHDANGDLRRLAQVRAVERNRRNRPTSQSLPGFLAQALEETIFHHIAHSATVSFTIDLFDPPDVGNPLCECNFLDVAGHVRKSAVAAPERPA